MSDLGSELGPTFQLTLNTETEFTLNVGTKTSSLYAGGGALGPRGFQGEVGPQGPQGETGPQGIQGIQGPGSVYLSDAVKTPQEFGAVADAVTVDNITTGTDNTAAINAWATYLRENKLKGEWPGGKYYCADTVHLGLCTIRGAGAPGNNRWAGSMTGLFSDGQPIATNTDGVGNTAFGRLDIENVVFASAGGAVSTIDLWDKEDFTGQVGLRLGYLTMTADAGIPEDEGDNFEQGFGTNRIVNCNFQDIGGWGMMLYKSWGDSIIMDCTFRCCGGKAAYDYGILLGDEAEGDHWGGDICIASSSVDTEFVRVHGFGSGHTSGSPLNNILYDNRGTMFKIGARKVNTDALFRDYLTANKMNMTACHVEGRAVYMDVLGTKWSKVDGSNINGGVAGLLGKVLIGYASNPSTDLRMQWSNTRVGSAAGFWLMQGNRVNLGNLHNATPGIVTPIYYWRGTAFELLGTEHGQNTPADVGWSINPQSDPTTMSGGSGITDDSSYLPFAMSSAIAVDPMDNLVPTFNDGLGGTVITRWTSSGLGTTAVDASGTFITVSGEPGDGAGGDIIECADIPVTEGELMTARLYVRSALEFGGGNVIIYLRDVGNNLIFRRDLGEGPQPAGLYLVEFNFIAPDGGELKFQFVNANDGPVFVDFCAPIIVRGLRSPSPRKNIPALWAASNGVFVTA